MGAKASLDRLIEELLDEALPAIEQYTVSVRGDPVLRAALLAPDNDEELSP
jgi:hypothetical protein